MKVSKISRLASFLLLFFYGHFNFAQITDEKVFYRDTIFEFNGWKIQVSKSMAYRDVFKSVVTVNNTSDQFLIFDLANISINEGSEKLPSASRKVVVVAPKYSKKINLKFTGRDFRHEVISYEVDKMQITEKIEAIYDLPDIDLNTETYRQVGGIQFMVVTKDYKPSDVSLAPNGVRIDKDKSHDYKILVDMAYAGDKFMGIYFNNIVLKTKDGTSYVNTGKKTGTFHYDKTKSSNKVTLVFPVETNKLGVENQPKLILKEVFKEYSLATIEGFKVTLTRGTLADYDKKQQDKSEDIEEME